MVSFSTHEMRVTGKGDVRGERGKRDGRKGISIPSGGKFCTQVK